MTEPANGLLLIAEPFLKDPSFMRSVVLICRHTEDEGTFGFSLNKILTVTLNEIISGVEGHELPVYQGGPVQTDTLHYLHQYPQFFPDAVKIIDGVYWGGDFEKIKLLIKDCTIDPQKIKFFLGYSGWSEGQLKEEMGQSTWLITPANRDIVFKTEPTEVWNAALTQLGGKYKMMIHFPTDPQLN